MPRLIADMNRQRLAFTAHDGDLKAGSGPCPDSLYTEAKASPRAGFTRELAGGAVLLVAAGVGLMAMAWAGERQELPA